MARDRDRAFFGHPLGLSNLFMTELFERFSYYGMRAFLFVFLIAPTSLGGKGLSEVTAGSILAVFLSSVYLLALPGGWIADRFVGQRKGVIIGGVGITLGNAILAIPGTGNLFFLGLVAIALGTGFLKPNISTLVGQLYKEGDGRRDAGYTIYYMGINIGATIAPFACGYLAQHPGFRATLSGAGIDPNLCWNFAFATSAFGMLLGLIQFISFNSWLGEAGKHPTIPEDPIRAKRDRGVLVAIAAALVGVGALVVLTTPTEDTIANVQGVGLLIGSIVMFVGLYKSARDAKERRGILAMIPLFVGAISFFAIFEQAPTTLTSFAEKMTLPTLAGITFPASYYQSVNAILIVGLAPVFAWIWVALARKGKEPYSVTKFAIGMALLSLAFVVMIPADASPQSKVSGMFLIGLYFFNTLAELCISPVGLSSMSKLAPKRLAGLVMGMWFFGTAIGIWLAGRATAVSAGKGFTWLFTFLFISSLVVSLVLFVISPRIKRMMGVDASTTVAPEHTEAEPLPTARVVDKD